MQLCYRWRHGVVERIAIDNSGVSNVAVRFDNDKGGFDDEAAELEAAERAAAADRAAATSAAEPGADADADADGARRHKVHVGRPEFSHLAEMDMDRLCARVVVYARKPLRSAR